MDDMDDPPDIICDRCNRRLSAGSSHYSMTLSLKAGFDGWLPIPKEGETVGEMVSACDNLDAKELEAQVSQVLEFTLCPKCRNHIALDPLNMATSKGSNTLQ